MCTICGRKTRGERMARGLFDRVAKGEKIRGLYVEREEPTKSRKGEKATYSDREYLKSG